MKQFTLRLSMALGTMALVLSPFGFTLTSSSLQSHAAYAREEGDSHQDDGSGSDEDISNWETPYDTPQSLLADFRDAEDSGSCWDLMNAKANLLLDETRYWSALAVPGSDGEHVLDSIVTHLLDLQVAMGNNRYNLEKRSGAAEQCEENEDLHYLQKPLEQLKIKMRRAGFKIDNDEPIELTNELVNKRCAAASENVKELGNRIDGLNQKLNEKAADGDFGEVSNLKELLNLASHFYGDASNHLSDSEDKTDLEEKMRECSGARDNAQIGLSLFKRANKFHKGKKEDSSSAVEEIDAKIKMFLSVIAEKKLESLAYDEETRDELFVLLSNAEEEIIAVQIAFAKIKYDDDANDEAKDFDDQLEEIKSALKPLVDALENNEAGKVTKKARRKSAKKLLTNSRKQIKKLNKQISKKDKKADTQDEEDIVQFVEQSVADDAQTARSASKAYRKNKQYEKAQLQALQAIHTAKAGKQVLKEVQ